MFLARSGAGSEHGRGDGDRLSRGVGKGDVEVLGSAGRRRTAAGSMRTAPRSPGGGSEAPAAVSRAPAAVGASREDESVRASSGLQGTGTTGTELRFIEHGEEKGRENAGRGRERSSGLITAMNGADDGFGEKNALAAQ